jgi:hypothetical protein
VTVRREELRVTASIAALAGIPEQEAGVASGLSNTTFQIGAALGVAVVATVSFTHTKDFFAANPHAARLVGLTEGFQSAFLACSVIAAAGAITALALLGRPRLSAEETLEPATLTASG